MGAWDLALLLVLVAGLAVIGFRVLVLSRPADGATRGTPDDDDLRSTLCVGSIGRPFVRRTGPSARARTPRDGDHAVVAYPVSVAGGQQLHDRRWAEGAGPGGCRAPSD